jgi:pimeloyl-ACP methyl ester carboxylesterase
MIGSAIILSERALMQSHYPPRQIKPGINSWAYYSKKSKNKAVIFLHGFGGKSVGTWLAFNNDLFREPKAAGYDIYFFGYEGRSWDLESCAQYFLKFLRKLFALKAAFRAEIKFPERDEHFKYEHVLIAAHSMAAVVSRRALLLADENGYLWPQKTRLVLFAPAHFGARVERLASEALLHLPFGPALMPILKFRWPPLEELKKESEYLEDLQSTVDKALVDHPEREYLIAQRVIHSYGDHVVEDKKKRFCKDGPSKFIDGSHTSMCKPTRKFRDPLDCLLAELR